MYSSLARLVPAAAAACRGLRDHGESQPLLSQMGFMTSGPQARKIIMPRRKKRVFYGKRCDSETFHLDKHVPDIGLNFDRTYQILDSVIKKRFFHENRCDSETFHRVKYAVWTCLSHVVGPTN